MREIWHELEDGRRLFCAGFDGDPARTPLVCLPGLSRSHRDFFPVTDRIAGTRPIYCLDMRGRGRSDRALDPDAEYQPTVELGDVIAICDRLGLGEVAVLGTSRGGIQTMLWGAMDVSRLAGAALVDIGPVIEEDGLRAVIAALNARKSAFESFEDAATRLQRAYGDRFTGMSDQEWLAMARRIFVETPQGVAPDHDPELVRVSAAAFEAGIAPFWELFETLAPVPTLALRGGNSDLLSSGTLLEMSARIPACDTVTVPGRGHPPILDEPEAALALDRWLARVDQAQAAKASANAEPADGA